MESRKASISANTIFKFPDEIVTYRYEGDTVVVSPNDGNWLVLSDAQVRIFDALKSGKTVDHVLSATPDKDVAKALLKQIMARDFTEKKLTVADRTSKAMFYLTYACNLACEHCYMFAQKNMAPELSVAEYKSIFEALGVNGVTAVTFSGGEPLMRPGFWQIIDAAQEHGFEIKIFSNGTLWTPNDISLAKRYGVKAQISIDGVDESSCAIVRGPNVFANAKNTALRLAQAGVDVEIATTPTMANIEMIERGYADFVAEMRNAGRIRFKVSQNLLPGRRISKLSSAQKRDYGQRGVRLYSISNPGGTQIPFFDEYRNGRGRIACGLGRLVFAPDGFIYVCSRLGSFPSLGNVRDIGVSGALSEARKRLAMASVDNTIPCRDCPLRHICGGGCRADRFEHVAASDGEFSVHKPCSETYKMMLLKMMVRATRECYAWR